MGGKEKSLLEVGGRPLVAHVAERLAPQVDRLVINANGDPARFGALGLPVVPDTMPANPGPLAGIAAGMAWGRQNLPAASHVLSMPADTPFFPADLRERLESGLTSEKTIPIARSAGRLHGACGLWPVEAERPILEALANGRNRVLDFVEAGEWVAVDFDAAEPAGVDPFFNINTPEDLEHAQALFAKT
jgi:molybdopterin-guanine dinucleotide biosynthesis protein A